MAGPSIRYRVSMPQPANHLLHVCMEADDPPAPTEICLPVWTPGSYMVREFARHVQDFRPTGSQGRPFPWRKTSKDCWLIESLPHEGLRIDFDVYANDLTVRTSHLDGTHAFFNPANLLPYVPGRAAQPLSLTVCAPETWVVSTGLAPVRSAERTFVATDYDELVDSPVHAGPGPLLSFEVDGIPHTIATWGHSNLDPDRLTADLRLIVQTQGALFCGLPYDRYLFILLATHGPRGGLEHRNSCALMIPRFDLRPGKPYERALKLLSHEFFHTWNGKRIRSEVLGPFDYSRENYTRLLWAMEGITEYYCTLLLRRAQLITPERYLELVAEQMSELAGISGRHLQSLEEASFDAWIKYYRPDEHSVNSSVSYYLKGALASLVLDLELRRRTGGQRSLDDLMRLFWERYGLANRGIPEDAYEPLVEELAGGDWTGFFDAAIRGRGDLQYGPPFATVGIEVDWRADSNAPEAWLGVKTHMEAGRTKVASVASDGPAWGSGLSAGDELLALDGYRVDDPGLADRLRDYHPGDTITLAVFRRDQLIEVPVTLARRPPARASLRRVARPSVRQRTMYESWLGGPW